MQTKAVDFRMRCFTDFAKSCSSDAGGGEGGVDVQTEYIEFWIDESLTRPTIVSKFVA